jgi:hypothetical protein
MLPLCTTFAFSAKGNTHIEIPHLGQIDGMFPTQNCSKGVEVFLKNKYFVNN